MNESGIHPQEFKILILPVATEQVTKGGIIKPDITKDSEKFRQVRGTIVELSPFAFTYAKRDEWAEFEAKKPKPGDLALYARNAGEFVKGKDGKDYLLINDKDLIATIEE